MAPAKSPGNCGDHSLPMPVKRPSHWPDAAVRTSVRGVVHCVLIGGRGRAGVLRPIHDQLGARLRRLQPEQARELHEAV